MTDTSDTHTHRRTALKLAGATGLSLAGLTGSAAAHPGNSQGRGRGRGNQNDEEEDDEEEDDEQEQNPGQGRGMWCCSCGWGRDQGPGYRRGYPHEDDETRWDDWEPGDGRPPWARGDGEDDDEDEDEDGDDEDEEEPEEPEEPETPDEDDDEDEQPDEGEDDEDEGEQDPETPPEEPPEEEPDEEPESPEQPDEPEEPPEEEPEEPENPDEGDDSDDSEDEETDFVAQVEERVHTLTNEYRAEQDVPPLDQSDDLADVARAHSEDMAENDYFSHDSQNGDGPGDRLDEAGVECNGWGENLAWEESSNVSEGDAESIANSALEGWISSDGHRENLLGNYDEEGIGVGVAEDEVYITQLFCSS